MKQPFTMAILLLLCSCAAGSGNKDAYDAEDPLRPVNEQTFAFNKGFDRYMMRPVAEAYHAAPALVRDKFGNFVDNLGEPANFVNDVMQLDSQAAFSSFWRFVLNSTIGIGGMNDFASLGHLPPQDQNFGKTLKHYGVHEGPYVVLPVLGPSTARDTAGQVVDWFTDPVGLYMNTTQTIAATAADNITTREDKLDAIDGLYYKAKDPYTATRAAYFQQSRMPEQR